MHLPESYKRAFERCLEKANEAKVATFRQELVGYEKLLETVDLSALPHLRKEAEQLIIEARIFLDLADEDAKHERRPHLLAAVIYLIQTDDAQADFARHDGLVDDAAVFAEVMRMFDLDLEVSNRLPKKFRWQKGA